jgi:hypothetical protein
MIAGGRETIVDRELEIYPLPTPFPKVLLQLRSLSLWLDESTPKLIAFFSTFISFKYSARLIRTLTKSTHSRSPNREKHYHRRGSQTRNLDEKGLVRWIDTFLWIAPSQMTGACDSVSTTSCGTSQRTKKCPAQNPLVQITFLLSARLIHEVWSKHPGLIVTPNNCS